MTGMYDLRVTNNTSFHFPGDGRAPADAKHRSSTWAEHAAHTSMLICQSSGCAWSCLLADGPAEATLHRKVQAGKRSKACTPSSCQSPSSWCGIYAEQILVRLGFRVN